MSIDPLLKSLIINAINEALISRDYKDGLLHVADILHVELPASAYQPDQTGVRLYTPVVEVK